MEKSVEKRMENRMLNRHLPVGLPQAEGPRVGQRYGQDVWLVKPGWLYSERRNKVIAVTPERIKRAGVTPQVPSLRAAIEGIHAGYGTTPKMGTDPEFFVTQNGLIVPAFDHLPDKHETRDGLFWDGFQAETTVPTTNHGSYCRPNCPGCNITCHAIMAQTLGKQLQKLVARNLDIAAQGVWRVPDGMLQLAGEAQVSLGCDPSRNAYGLYGRCVLEPRKLLWRFTGGHVHFELTQQERADADLIRYLVKTLDALLGIPSVCLAQNFDHFIRRRYYGLAGEYRLPPHGLEYRTLSNFWLMHPRAFMLVFDLARHALNVGRSRMRNIFVGSERAIRDTINYSDVKSARDFMRLNREFYTQWTRMLYGTERPFWAAIEGGVDGVIENWGRNVVASWRLPDSWKAVPAWRDLQ